MIVVRHIADSLVPSDIVESDGTIVANDTFVKAMHVLNERGMHSMTFGLVYEFPKENESRLNFKPSVTSDLYSSILYSLAIHTLRGHFPLNGLGVPVFRPDEFVAQGERGHKYLYINMMAMMFYWIIVVEQHRYPVARADTFIRLYPHVFRSMTDEQRRRFPGDLQEFCLNLLDKEAVPFHENVVATGLDPNAGRDMLRGCVSNEGTATSP
jgi:hypothetical protein